MSWYDRMIQEIDRKIQEAGDHVVVVPAQQTEAPIDTVDIFDGHQKQFIARAVPETPAQEFAVIWNNLVDTGQTDAVDQKKLIAWITS